MAKELEILFNSKPRVKVLKFFFQREGSFHLKEVRKRCNLPLNIIKKELKKLSKINLLKKEKKKGKYFFSLNPNFPFFFELRSMIQKTQPLSLKKATLLFKKIRKIKLLVFSGIFLKEERSPVDILIVGNNITPAEIQKVIKKIEKDIGKEIKWSLFTKEEFEYRLKVQDRFLRDIFEHMHKKVIDSLGPKR